MGKQAWWVLAIEVDVAEHCGCTVIAFIIDVCIKRACKFLERITAVFSRIFWPFAPACDDGVVLELKVHRTIPLGLQQGPPRSRSSGRLEHAVGDEGGSGGEPDQEGGQDEEEREPTAGSHRASLRH